MRIARDVEEWIGAIEEALADEGREAWLARVDARLARASWDTTWAGMDALIDHAADGRLAEPVDGLETERAAERDGMAAAAGD